MKRILRFGIAGGIGFLADAGMLWLLMAATPLGPFLARIASIAFAMVVTWTINRNLTFARSGRGAVSEAARYGGVGVSAALVNYCVYSGLLLTVPGMPPFVALVIACAAAMVLSYLGYARLVFDR